jgi:hypothetical protein
MKITDTEKLSAVVFGTQNWPAILLPGQAAAGTFGAIIFMFNQTGKLA